MHAAGAGDLKLNPFGLGTGGDGEVVLQLTVIAVVEQIDSRVNVLVANLIVGGNVSSPLVRIVANKVVDPTALRDFSYHGRILCGPQKAELQRRFLGWMDCPIASCYVVCAERKHHPVAREKCRVSWSARNEPYAWVCLASVCLERQRTFAVVGIDQRVSQPFSAR